MPEAVPTTAGGHAICYLLQIRRCGKCRTCTEGPGHGPYWYAYWRVDGDKVKSAYIGKQLKAKIAYQVIEAKSEGFEEVYLGL